MKMIRCMFVLLLVLAMMIPLAGCGSFAGKHDLTASFTVLDDGSDEGLLYITNSGNATYCTGLSSYYSIQHWSGEDWETIVENENPDNSYEWMGVLAPGKTWKWNIPICIYRPLEPGKYRLVLEFVRGDPEKCGKEKLVNTDIITVVFDPPENLRRVTTTAEFTLTENYNSWHSGDTPYNETIRARMNAAKEQQRRLRNVFRAEAGLNTKTGFDLWPRDYPPEYGGCYINTDGDMVLLVTEGYEDTVGRFRELTENPDILWRTVPYSYSELLALQLSMVLYERRPTLGFDLLGSWVDEYDNCVRVLLSSADNETVSAFRHTVTDSEAVVIENYP